MFRQKIQGGFFTMDMSSFSLEGKIALITGASYGIGMAIAKGMAAAGATIVFNDIKQELVDKGIAAYKEAGIEAHGYVCDVRNEDAVNEMVAKIAKEVAPIDILVNNAGITRDKLVLNMDEKDFDAVINVNLKGTFNMIKHTYKHFMKKRYGRICSTASIVGLTGNAGQANYSAAKAGLIGLTKTLAKELGSRGIRVNAIAPGFINTDMTKDLDTSKFTDFIPLKRLGEPEDIAKAVKFLAADSDYITGQVLEVDGGLII